MTSFRYDVSKNLVSFDYYTWLVQRAAEGATEIVHDTTKGWHPSIWPEEVMRRRFDSIVVPGPALLGLPSHEGSDGKDEGTHRLREFVNFVSRGGKFPRLQSVLPARTDVKYTVTLRRQPSKSPFRNSDQEAWASFAKYIGAKVIDDFDFDPIHLHERLALYAGAVMNFGVSCGPMFLLTLTPYPMMMFNWGYGHGPFMAKIGIDITKKPAWTLPNQHVTPERDYLPVLIRHFEKLGLKR